MTAAIATGESALRSFVTGLRADQDAVTAGLSLPWSSGAKCTAARTPTCSAAASCSPTNDKETASRKVGQEPGFGCR